MIPLWVLLGKMAVNLANYATFHFLFFLLHYDHKSYKKKSTVDVFCQLIVAVFPEMSHFAFLSSFLSQRVAFLCIVPILPSILHRLNTLCVAVCSQGAPHLTSSTCCFSLHICKPFFVAQPFVVLWSLLILWLTNWGLEDALVGFWLQFGPLFQTHFLSLVWICANWWDRGWHRKRI